MARRMEDEVSDWEAPPGLLERILADEAALDSGQQKGMDWEEFEPILLGWIAEGEALGREAGEDEAP